MRPLTAEQEARDMLERIGVDDAQSFSSGELVELANLIVAARAGLADTERLDKLIDWLGLHDDLEGSGIRDWDDNADARAAIDHSVRLRSGYPHDSKGGADGR